MKKSNNKYSNYIEFLNEEGSNIDSRKAIKKLISIYKFDTKEAEGKYRSWKSDFMKIKF